MSGPGNDGAPGGRLLGGRYRVIEQLGRGGMGMVSRAMDEVLHREVAVKELRTYNDASEEELADLRLRMQREARAAARIRHPSVIAVYDVADEDGRPVIVMELVDGPSLDDVLRGEVPLDPREAASIGARVAEALGAAHAAGVLHRDVKPGNVLLERGGRVVLTDFGIAAMEEPGDGTSSHLTQSGQVVGSLDFLAPERAQGERPGPASDIWSLGATLFAAVEGGAPFRRTSTWSTLAAIVSEPLPEPRRAGPLAPVLRELLNKDPAARPDAVRARLLLEAVARESGAAADPGDGLGEAGRPAAGRPQDAAPQAPGRVVAPGIPGGAAEPAAAQAAAPAPSPAAAAPAEPPAGSEAGWRPPTGPGPFPGVGAAPRHDPRPTSVPPRRPRRLAAIAAAAAVAVVGAGLTWLVAAPSAPRTAAAGASGPTPYISGPQSPSAPGAMNTAAGKTGLAYTGTSASASAGPSAIAGSVPSSAASTTAKPGRTAAQPASTPLPVPSDPGYIPGSLATTDGCEAWLDYKVSSTGGFAMATLLSTGAPCEMHFFRKYTPNAASTQNLDSYHTLTSAQKVSTYWYWDGPSYFAGVCLWRTDHPGAQTCGGRYYVQDNKPTAE